MVKLSKTQQFAAAWVSAMRMEASHERMVAWEVFRDEWNGKVFKAVVVVGGPNSTEFYVKGLNDEGSFWIYACNIPGKKTWYQDTACVYYDNGQEVEVRFDIQYGATFCVGVTPGTVNEEKWASLDQSRLAFKCDESGKPTTGLFAKGAF